MLTPEQTRLRIQDGEIRELRAENERLKQKIKTMLSGVKEFSLAYAETLPYKQRAKIIEMVKDIED